MRPGPLWPSSGTDSGAAGERPVPAAPASILCRALSQPIWGGRILHPEGLGNSRPSKTPPDSGWLARGRRSPLLPQNTFFGPSTRWAPLKASQDMCLSHSRTRFCAPHASMRCLYVWVCAGMCRYVQVYHGVNINKYLQVCAGMCRYVHYSRYVQACAVSTSICRYVQVCAGMCQYVLVPEGMLDTFHPLLNLVSLDGSLVHSVINAPAVGCSISRNVEGVLL